MRDRSDNRPLVIFDCDGVLVETEAVGARVDQRILAELGWELSLEEIAERFVGGTTDHFLAGVEAGLGAPLEFDWHERFGPRYLQAYEEQLTPVQGIPSVLEALDRPTCVASNSTIDHVRHVLGLTGLLRHFEGRIFNAEQVERGKPAPDLFLHAATSLGFDPESCVVVEDSVPGVTAARAAGMTVLGYVGGLTPPARLQGMATITFSSMDDLPDLIDSVVGSRT